MYSHPNRDNWCCITKFLTALNTSRFLQILSFFYYFLNPVLHPHKKQLILNRKLFGKSKQNSFSSIFTPFYYISFWQQFSVKFYYILLILVLFQFFTTFYYFFIFYYFFRDCVGREGGGTNNQHYESSKPKLKFLKNRQFSILDKSADMADINGRQVI